MSRSLSFELPPTQVDIVVSRAIEHHATPLVERAGKVLTIAADEKPLLAAALTYWIYSRAQFRPRTRRRADHLLLCTAVAAALPHLLKHFVARERPDRKLVHGARHGIPRSGDLRHSFPSGHALHLGAWAAALTRTASARIAWIGWGISLALASTRLLVLAHYVTDVLGGMLLGVLVEGGLAQRYDKRDWKG
jgi:undecaprenyl-diphosphatase